MSETVIDRTEHFPDPEGRAILVALVAKEVQTHNSTATTRLYVLEMWAKECGSWGHTAYQMRCKAFWDGASPQESAWFYSAKDALEAWEEFSGHKCPETQSGLKILAAQRQAV